MTRSKLAVEPGLLAEARLAAARGGSTQAVGELLESCRDYLWLVAQQQIGDDLKAKGGASDLVQQTFLEAHQSFAQFDGHAEEELIAWLRTILQNNVLNFTRMYRQTAKRLVEREVRLDPESSAGVRVQAQLAAPGESPSQEVLLAERKQQIDRALDRLPPDYRQVIVLRHQQGQSFVEIGRAMQRTPDAVRKLWWRAVERMAQELM